MRPEEHRKLFELEDTYWWFVGRRAIIRTLLCRHTPVRPSRLALDIGCGTGRNLVLLNELAVAIGADPSPGALGFCRERGLGLLVGARMERLPFSDGSVDIVTAFDVLEHVRDDAAAVAESARVLRPGGCLMLTLPAYGFLWSEHDDALDHLRRYGAGQVRRLVESAGLQVVRLGYCITFLFLPILVFRLLQRLRARLSRGAGRRPSTAFIQMPPLVSRLFVGLLRLEAWLLRWVDLPFGVSIVCVARKPSD